MIWIVTGFMIISLIFDRKLKKQNIQSKSLSIDSGNNCKKDKRMENIGCDIQTKSELESISNTNNNELNNELFELNKENETVNIDNINELNTFSLYNISRLDLFVSVLLSAFCV